MYIINELNLVPEIFTMKHMHHLPSAPLIILIIIIGTFGILLFEIVSIMSISYSKLHNSIFHTHTHTHTHIHTHTGLMCTICSHFMRTESQRT